MSLTNRIKQTREYQSNSLVRPGDLCDRFGEPMMNIRSACVALVEQGLMQRDGMFFRKAGRHWIHMARLNDSDALKAHRGEG